jgi:hypothetical protein
MSTFSFGAQKKKKELPDNTLSILKQLYSDTDSHDCLFLCTDGKTLPFHKNVLAQQMVDFQPICFFKRSDQEVQKPVTEIDIPLSFKSASLFLKFLYCVQTDDDCTVNETIDAYNYLITLTPEYDFISERMIAQMSRLLQHTNDLEPFLRVYHYPFLTPKFKDRMRDPSTFISSCEHGSFEQLLSTYSKNTQNTLSANRNHLSFPTNQIINQ